MGRLAILLFLVLAVPLLPIGSAAAQITEPDPSCSLVTTNAPGTVSVYTLPDGGGAPLTQAIASPAPGQAVAVDATVTFVLIACYMGPVPYFPAEDMWLGTAFTGLKLCPGGSSADGPTNIEGKTTFTQAIRGGGHSDRSAGERTFVFLNGDVIAQPLDIQFNSPDINGDLLVNLSDTVLYAGDCTGGTYAYRSDFHYDEQLNLSDTVLYARGIGKACP